MKKKHSARGIAVLLLWAALLSLGALMFSGKRLDSPEGIGPVLDRVSLALWIGFGGALIIFSKKRLRLISLLAAAAALGAFMGRMDLTRGQAALAAIGAALLYLLGCIAANYLRYGKSVRALNAAAASYRETRDGEAFLTALDALSPRFNEQQTVRRPDAGTVTFREHLLCEKIQVLGDMGRLEERRTLMDRLRRETKSPGLLAWLDEKAAEYEADGPIE